MAQPTLLNRVDPLLIEVDDDAGVGGAARRMKAAKLITSPDISLAVPVVPPVLGLVICVASSGRRLKMQPACSDRSLPKPSLVTPCSTLYASIPKISSDLFCAFQPKRVIVPSFP